MTFYVVVTVDILQIVENAITLDIIINFLKNNISLNWYKYYNEPYKSLMFTILYCIVMYYLYMFYFSLVSLFAEETSLMSSKHMQSSVIKTSKFMVQFHFTLLLNYHFHHLLISLYHLIFGTLTIISMNFYLALPEQLLL